MTAMAFDMLDFAAELIESGVPDKQANAYAKTYSKAQRSSEEKIIETIIEKVKHDYRLDDVATKRDIRELELSIELVKRDIKELDLTIQSRIKDVESKIDNVKGETIKSIALLIITAFLAQTGATFFILRMLNKI